MSLALHVLNPCTKCGQVKMRSVIEAHASDNSLALHRFYCADCGPVKTEIISLKPPARSSEVAA
jgi:hypothetical protein